MKLSPESSVFPSCTFSGWLLGWWKTNAPPLFFLFLGGSFGSSLQCTYQTYQCFYQHPEKSLLPHWNNTSLESIPGGKFLEASRVIFSQVFKWIVVVVVSCHTHLCTLGGWGGLLHRLQAWWRETVGCRGLNPGLSDDKAWAISLCSFESSISLAL